ncbi:MAG: carboxylating nicotinate-nucleotide diphosphorylase [Elusimicrobia bacterium]|nr:carboxylating nicotinate-nucleotide diphosphorylase [Elusimicrobiota bacterium]
MGQYDKIIKTALKEDIGRGDITTGLFIPKNAVFKGVIIAKEKGILCGVEIAGRVFKITDRRIKVKIHLRDGAALKKGSKIMTVAGSGKILTAERTALNFLQRLSGIATLTNRFVKKLGSGKTAVYDTRKTTPGLRSLEKYAVKCGGGKNHRFGLFDMFLVKDNHLAVLGRNCAGKLREKISLARKKHKELLIEMEAGSLKQVKNFMPLNPDIIMLDNMSFRELKKAVKLIRKGGKAERRKGGKGRPEIEISGGVNLKNISRISKTGPERISIGALTHSAKSIDMSMEMR